ncbi:MAG TPA: hypothetical protein VGH89_17315 [Pseudonocardia sp.]|jgi:hypothetical protein
MATQTPANRVVSALSELSLAAWQPTGTGPLTLGSLTGLLADFAAGRANPVVPAQRTAAANIASR